MRLRTILAALLVLLATTARASRIALLDRIDSARIDGPAAAGGPLAYASPYRQLSNGRARYVSIITLHTDQTKKAFEMRETLALGPHARASFAVSLGQGVGEPVFDAGIYASGGRAAIEVSWNGASAMSFPVGVSGTNGRPKWTEVRQVLKGAMGDGEITVRNKTERSVWIANPALVATRGRAAPVADPADVNVVLVMVDTMTAEAVGHLGAKYGVTPEIDALARKGVAFSNAVTNANWTRPGTIALLAGDYSSAFGINVHSWQLSVAARREMYAIRPDTLPLLARATGRSAVAIGNNLFVMGYHAAGVDFGFDRVVDYRTDVRDTVDIATDVERYFRGQRDGRFFLYVALNAPHHPYEPPAAHLAQVRVPPGERLDPEVRRYLGEVAYTDAAVGRIARGIAAAGISDTTVLIVTSDHGEGLRADNAYTNVVFERPSRFTHTVNLYDEVVRVPLVMVGPGVRAGVTVEAQVRSLDVAPTIADLLGARQSTHRGSSLGSALLGDAIEDRAAYTEGKRMSSVRTRAFKYIRREKGFEVIRAFGADRGRAVPEEYYDLARDAREKENLVSREPARVAEARRLWETLRAEATTVRMRPAMRRASAPGGVAGDAAQTRPRRSAMTSFAFNGDGRPHTVRGEIRTSGRFVDWKLDAREAGSGVWLASDKRLLVSLVASTGAARLDLATEPENAPLSLELMVDGRPLDEEVLRVGALGLALLARTTPAEEKPRIGTGERGGWDWGRNELAIIYAPRPPRFAVGRELGLFVWSTGRPRGEAGSDYAEAGQTSESGKSTALDQGVEEAMRAWGYIQGGRAKSRKGKGDLE